MHREQARHSKHREENGGSSNADDGGSKIQNLNFNFQVRLMFVNE
jgi:hypothetical protein